MALPLSQLAARCGAGRLNGDENTLITGVASLQTGGAQRLAFFSGGNLRALADTTAAAVVLRADDDDAIAKTPAGCAQWLVEGEPRAYFSRAIAQLYPAPAAEFAGVSAAAHIAADARLGDEVAVAATAVIGAKAVIGAGSIIYPGTVIAAGAVIGRQCVLYPQVCLYPRVRLGDGCVIHAGTVIGADGFGYTAADGAGVNKIRQLGGVKIGNRVEVGANSAIDCGALDDTVIGDDVKIDNLVQIGHNVVIGEQTIICGKVGIAGSVVVGRCCVIGGGSGIADHLVIGDAVKIAGATSISRNVPAGEIMSSMMPAMPIRSWRRFVAGLRRRLGR